MNDHTTAKLESMQLRQMDESLETEVHLLCACWMDEDNTKTLLGNLNVNDFHTGSGRLQFEVLAESWRRYRDVSPMSLRKISAEMGGSYFDSYGLMLDQYMGDIGRGVGPGLMRALMQQVSEETTRVKLVNALGQAQAALMNRDLTLSQAQAQTSELLYKASFSRRDNKPQSWDEGFANLEEKLRQRIEAKASGNEISDFLATGMGPLDEIIQGIGVPEFCILAARPGVGKTAAALQIATYVAQHYGPVLFLSLELSKEVCWKRIACQQLRLPYKDFEEKPDLVAQVRKLNFRLYIDDAPIKANRVRERVEYFMSEHPGTALIVGDQLSKMVESSADYKQMTQGCNLCCAVTNELKVPFVLCAQVGRKAELREEGKPGLNDLKATGALEEDARKILFIHRPWTLKPGKCDPRDAQIIVAKNGDGSGGTADMYFDGPTYTFSTPTESKFKGRKSKKDDAPPPPSDDDAPLLGKKLF